MSNFNGEFKRGKAMPAMRQAVGPSMDRTYCEEEIAAGVRAAEEAQASGKSSMDIRGSLYAKGMSSGDIAETISRVNYRNMSGTKGSGK